MARAIVATAAASGRGRRRRGPRAAAALLALAGLSGTGTSAPAATLSLPLVALEGQSVPAAGSGVTLGALWGGPIDDAGRVTFKAGLEGAGVDSSNDSSILRSDGAGGLDLVLREGDSAPGAAGAEFDQLGSAGQPAGLGHIVVSTTLRGAGVGSDNDQGIWLWEDPGTLSLVARDGDPAPGTGAGVVYYNPRQFEANSSGQLAFQSWLTGSGVDSTNPNGIWFHDPTTGTQLVAWAGEPAPGTPAGTNFFRLSTPPEINDAGQIAFSARTTAGAGSYPGGIWLADGPGEPLTARLLTGDAAPGTPPGVTFGGFSLSDMNGGGELAFGGSLSGPGVTSDNDAGIWGPDGAGGLTLIAREGDPVPGLLGVSFEAIETLTPPLNAHGDVAFKAIWSEVVEEEEEFGWGLFVRTGEGALRTVVRSGDLLEVEPGSFREVYEPFLADLDDARQLTFLARFTGGSTGIFLTTVPEPGTAALLAFGLAALTLTTRRRPKSA